MKRMILRNIFIILCITSISNAQNFLVPLHSHEEVLYSDSIYETGKIHTSIRPYIVPKIPQIALKEQYKGQPNKFQKPYFFQKHNACIYFQPLYEFSGGYSSENEFNISNVRAGFSATLSCTKKLSIHLEPYILLRNYPDDISYKADTTGYVPYNSKSIEKTGTVFLNIPVKADIVYQPTQYFTLQLGRGGHFLGDGYRSLFLSNNSGPYNNASIQFTHKWLSYKVVYASLPDVDYNSKDYTSHPKYGTFRVISFNVTKKLNLNAFESVVWSGRDSIGNRNFELHYINPVIFLRPVEFSLGSPDNVLMGIGAKLNVFKKAYAYSQFLIDEFYLKHMKAKDGWWGNKFGVQAGYKHFDVAGVKGLFVQIEGNLMRPFTYSHQSSLQNYGHNWQPLAHPVGANFSELICNLKYAKKGWFFESSTVIALAGRDSANASYSYGSDIYKPYTLRNGDEGHFMHNGDKTNFMYQNLTISRYLKSRFPAQLFLSFRSRIQRNSEKSAQVFSFLFGIRSSVFNNGYDFF